MKNKEKKNLEDFSLSQLNILLKHLRLGFDHLKLLLTPQKLQELLEWCDLKEKYKKQISSDRIERLGNMSLIINTILTSTFGAWMGLSGCIGCQLGSLTALAFISTLAFFVSGMIGYMSLKLTQRQARNAINHQIIYQFQLRVLKVINQKIDEKIKMIAFYLNTSVFILENKKEEISSKKNDLNLFKNTSEAYQWLEKLKAALQTRLEEVNKPISYVLYQKQITQMTYRIQKTLAKQVHFLENLSQSKEQEKRALQIMPTLPFLKILTNPSFGMPKYQSKPSSWIKNHFYPLLLGMIPTIWGSFASMFVFVGGIPNIARELNFIWLANLLTTPLARVIEITMAALMTFYFAFAFLYSSRKSWQREQLRRKIEKEIGDEEALLLENNHRLEMLSKVKMYTQKLISIFTVVKKIDQNLTIQNSAFKQEVEKLP